MILGKIGPNALSVEEEKRGGAHTALGAGRRYIPEGRRGTRNDYKGSQPLRSGSVGLKDLHSITVNTKKQTPKGGGKWKGGIVSEGKGPS